MNRLSSKRDPSFICTWLLDERGDRCEHVENDSTLAHAVFCEDDSFGPVLRNVVCEWCFKTAEEEESKRLCICADCKRGVPKAQTAEWRWYDFYAAQGDEPLVICNACWGAEKHKARMRADRDAAQAEDEYNEYGTHH